MQIISLVGLKVIHNGIVLNALALRNIKMRAKEEGTTRETIEKPIFLEVIAINEDGNIISIYDEAWTFQFMPIVKP